MDNKTVLLRECDISYEEGATPLLPCGSESGDLTLTNDAIVFEWEEGLFKKQSQSVCIPLDSIQLHNGLARIRATKPVSFGGHFPLIVSTIEGDHVFYFPPGKKKEIGQWFEAINKAVTGEAISFNPQDLSSFQIGKKIKDAIESAKPVTSDLADAATPFLDAAAPVVSAVAEVASVRHPYAATAINVGLESISTQREASSSYGVSNGDVSPAGIDSASSLDSQIESVKKLKDLLDAGILSQEEFDAKKKQIMGL